MCNAEVREKMKKHRLYQYQVASKLGVSECTFIRWLREELPSEKKELVLSAIAELEQEG